MTFLSAAYAFVTRPIRALFGSKPAPTEPPALEAPPVEALAVTKPETVPDLQALYDLAERVAHGCDPQTLDALIRHAQAAARMDVDPFDPENNPDDHLLLKERAALDARLENREAALDFANARLAARCEERSQETKTPMALWQQGAVVVLAIGLTLAAAVTMTFPLEHLFAAFTSVPLQRVGFGFAFALFIAGAVTNTKLVIARMGVVGDRITTPLLLLAAVLVPVGFYFGRMALEGMHPNTALFWLAVESALLLSAVGLGIGLHAARVRHNAEQRQKDITRGLVEDAEAVRNDAERDRDAVRDAIAAIDKHIQDRSRAARYAQRLEDLARTGVEARVLTRSPHPLPPMGATEGEPLVNK